MASGRKAGGGLGGCGRQTQAPPLFIVELPVRKSPARGESFPEDLGRTFARCSRLRDAFQGEIARAIVDYCQKNGGFLRSGFPNTIHWVELFD